MQTQTHVGGLLVVVYVVHVSGEAEVCDLHHIVIGNQNVPGGQVSVDTLQREEGESNTSGHTRDDTVHMLLSLGLDLLGLGWTRLGL